MNPPDPLDNFFLFSYMYKADPTDPILSRILFSPDPTDPSDPADPILVGSKVHIQDLRSALIFFLALRC